MSVKRHNSYILVITATADRRSERVEVLINVIQALCHYIHKVVEVHAQSIQFASQVGDVGLSSVDNSSMIGRRHNRYNRGVRVNVREIGIIMVYSLSVTG